MKKVKLAPILREAADKYLKIDNSYSYNKSIYSCCVVDFCIEKRFKNKGGYYGYWIKLEKVQNQAKKFLKSLGCPTGSLAAFKKYEDRNSSATKTSQSIRYAWLHLAATIAEEQNVELTVDF